MISLTTGHKSPRTLSVLLLNSSLTKNYVCVCAYVRACVCVWVCAYGFRCPARSKEESYLLSCELHGRDAGNHNGVLWKTRATLLRAKPSPHILFFLHYYIFSCLKIYLLLCAWILCLHVCVADTHIYHKWKGCIPRNWSYR